MAAEHSNESNECYTSGKTLGTEYGEMLKRKNIKRNVHHELLDVKKHGEAEVHRRLWKYISAGNYQAVLDSPSVTSEMLMQLRNTSESHVWREEIDRHQNLSADGIRKLVTDFGMLNTSAVLENPNCPESVYEAFREQPELSRRFHKLAGKNPYLPNRFWKVLLQENTHNHRLMSQTIRNANIPAEELQQYADQYPYDVLRNQHTPTWLLQKILLESQSPSVRAIPSNMLEYVIQHPNITPRLFSSVVESSINNVLNSHDAIVHHPFMTDELLQQIHKAFPQEKALIVCSNSDAITEYAKRGDMATVTGLVRNSEATAADLQVIYERTHFGDLQEEREQYDKDMATPFILEIVLHDNVSIELILQLLRKTNMAAFLAEYCVYEELFLKAQTPLQFMQCLVSYENYEPEEYTWFIRNPKMPLSLFPIVQMTVEQKSGFHEGRFIVEERKTHVLNELNLIWELRKEEQNTHVRSAA